MIQLTDEQIEKARQLIINPPPNSKIAAAKEFGIDMTLLLRRLKLTPEQRLDELQQTMESFEEFRREAAKNFNIKRKA
ncbi:hypothetical protein BH20ACI4_BH20ACI4_25660 [soil metagenome]